MDETGKGILEQALERRDYVIHHFFNQNVYAFSQDGVFQDTRHRLNADTRVIAEATAMILGLVDGFCGALRIDKSGLLIKQDT